MDQHGNYDKPTPTQEQRQLLQWLVLQWQAQKRDALQRQARQRQQLPQQLPQLPQEPPQPQEPQPGPSQQPQQPQPGPSQQPQPHELSLTIARPTIGTRQDGCHQSSRAPQGASAQTRHSSVNDVRPTKQKRPLAVVSNKHSKRQKTSTHPPVSIFDKTLQQIFKEQDDATRDLPWCTCEPLARPVSPPMQAWKPQLHSPPPEAGSSTSLIELTPATAFARPPPTTNAQPPPTATVPRLPPPTDVQTPPPTPTVPTHKTLPPKAIYKPVLFDPTTRGPNEPRRWVRGPTPELKPPPLQNMNHLPPATADFIKRCGAQEYKKRGLLKDAQRAWTESRESNQEIPTIDDLLHGTAGYEGLHRRLQGSRAASGWNFEKDEVVVLSP